MTDPKTRAPEYWRTFAWLAVASTVIVLAAGAGSVTLGSPAGWVVVALAFIPGVQAVRFFRRSQRQRDDR